MKPPHILAVDARPEDLLTIRLSLAPLDVQLVETGGGVAAVAETQRHDFALVIMGGRAGVPDALDTIRRLRRRDATAELPVLCLTDDEWCDERLRSACELGSVDFLQGPIRAETLRSRVSLVLAFHRRGAELAAARDEVRALEDDLGDLVRRRTVEPGASEHERVLLAAALDQSPSAVLLLTRTGIIEFANPAFERVSGLGRREVLGRRPTFLRDAENRDAFRGIVARVSDGQAWAGSLSAHAASHDRARFDVTVTPIRAASGEIRHLCCMARDVTRESELDSHLRRAQRLEAVGRLASGLAHDFNNVLGVIETSASYALRQLEPDSTAAVELAEIREAVKSASALSRQLLTFGSNREAGPGESESEPEVVIQRVHKMFGRLVGETVSLQISVDPDLPHVAIDGSKLEQVIANLLVNARDALPAGGRIDIGAGLVTVERHAIPPGFDAAGGEYVRLTVADDGMGMNEETLSRIFEPFFTTKGPDEGTGLGLATVYGLVGQAGGFLEVGSKVGQGTEFRIHLPVVRTPRAKLDAIAARAGASWPACEGRVLLVSDKSSVRATMARHLRNAGFQTDEASGVRDALAGGDVSADDVDMVVTEVHLRDGSGEDVVRALRSRRPGLPVLFVSGTHGEERQVAHRWSPHAEAVTQPFGEPGLARRVKRLLEQARLPQPVDAKGRGAG